MKTQRKKGGLDAAPVYRQPLAETINGYLTCLDQLPDPATRRVKWQPRKAVLAGVLMALSGHGAIMGRCRDALACLHHDPAHAALPASYNGLIKALLRQQDTVMPVLKAALKRHAAAALEKIPKTCGLTLLAVDGSKADLPRTVSH